MLTTILVGLGCAGVGLWIGARLGARVATARAGKYIDDIREVLVNEDKDALVLFDSARTTVEQANRGVVQGS